MAREEIRASGGVAAAEMGREGDVAVQDFLDRFAGALTAGDAATVASLWETPALVLGDEMAQVVGSRQEVERFFAGAKDEYNKRGISGTRADIQGLDWATDRIAIVTVRWPYLDSSGRERGEESSTYILRRDDQGNLKLRAAVMRGEVTS
jgi:ketosteroid isomerase-like protein